MNILLEEGAVPLYQQLYARLKQDILEGIYPKNAKLPSKRELATKLNISQNTVINAYEQLLDEGYLRSEKRRGYFVEDIPFITVTKPQSTKLKDPFLKERNYDYSFSQHGIDRFSFPKGLWTKLTKQAIELLGERLTQEPDPRGIFPLRQAIANYLRSNRGMDISPHQIVIRSGVESLFPIIFLLLGQNAIFALEDPGYERLRPLFSSHQVPWEPWPLDEKGISIQKNSKAQVLCITPSHQFPTGTIMPISRRQELLAWAQENQAYLIEDDYDSEFKYRGLPIPALKSLDIHDRVIYIGSFSKSLSPGIRISYMVLPQSMMMKPQTQQIITSSSVPLITQMTLALFMDQGHFDRHLNRMRTLYGKKRELVVEIIETWEEDIHISGADAGIHLLLTLNDKKDERTLVNHLHANGLEIYGLSQYSHKACQKDHPPSLLLGFGALDLEEIPIALEKLRTLLSAYTERS